VTIGVGSGRQKHTLERWRLINGGLWLEAEITVTDPEHLTEPVTTYYQWRKLPDRELSREHCEVGQA